MNRSVSIMPHEVVLASAFQQHGTGHAPTAAVLSPDGDGTGPSPVSKRQLRVLVADDYSDAADSLSTLLQIWGHQVWVARDGPAALEMAAACQADVLLLDITMPKMDGCQVARELRRRPRFKDALLIAITGWADQAHRLRGEQAGFDLYLVKPVAPSTLEILLTLEQDRLAHSSAPRFGSVAKRRHPVGGRRAPKRKRVACVR